MKNAYENCNRNAWKVKVAHWKCLTLTIKEFLYCDSNINNIAIIKNNVLFKEKNQKCAAEAQTRTVQASHWSLVL